jgi:hypothetical protein
MFKKVLTSFLTLLLPLLVGATLGMGVFAPSWAQAGMVCEDLFAFTTVKQADPAALEAASKYLTAVIQSGKPFQFDQAVEYALLSLPEGKLKEDFALSLKKNILGNNVTVAERTGLRSLVGSSRVSYYSRLLHPLRDSNTLAKKIIWNAKTVRTPNEALNQVFQAIHLVLETDFKPIRALGVYYSGRGGHMNEFLNSAEKLFDTQYEVYRSTQDFSPVSIPKDSKAKVAFQKVRRIFSNLLWLRQYRTIRDLNLSQEAVNAIESHDPLATRQLLKKRYGTEILVQWYMTHLRNVQNAAFLAIATVVAPPLTSAVVHQHNLETLGTAKLDIASVQRAEEVIQGSNVEIIILIQQELKKGPSAELNPAETEFLNEVNQALTLELK